MGDLVSKGFRIPLALDPQGDQTSPENASRDLDYVCPACGSPVTYKHGEKVSAHFAHKASQSCSRETVIHKIAKQMVAKAVQDGLSGCGPAPILSLACSDCHKSDRQDLKGTVTDVQIEYRLPSGYVADVALLNGDQVVLVVEIRVSHAVGDDKARDLRVPFVELDGYELTHTEPPRSRGRSLWPRSASTPTVWSPIQTNVALLECSHCQERLTRFKQKLVRVAAACGLEIPRAYYRPGISHCEKCEKEIIVFTWFHSSRRNDNAPRVKPIPLTVQFRTNRASKTSTWLCVCPYCGTAQDPSSHYGPGGPFWSCRRSLRWFAKDYEADLQQIASIADYHGVI